MLVPALGLPRDLPARIFLCFPRVRQEPR